MTTPHPEQPAEGPDDVPEDDPGSDDAPAARDTDSPVIVEEPGALEV
jgi:hypothetical protein